MPIAAPHPIMFDLPQGANINLLTQPLMQGLNTYRKGMAEQFQGERELAQEKQAQERLDMAKSAAADARNERMMKSFGNMALAVVNEPDEAKAQAYWQKIRALPEFASEATKAGLDLNDHRGTARILAARAGVLPDPLEQQQKQAAIAASQSSTALHNAQLKQFKAQTPAARAQLAPSLGLAPGTPEHNAFVINGTYTPRAPKYEKVGEAIVRIDADGNTKEVYKGEPNFDKLPEFSAKSAGFAARMVDAERNVQDLMSPANAGQQASSFDPTSAKAGVLNATTGTPLETATNYALRSPGHQRYMQAAEQWIRAFLRKESGAAIGKDEFQRDFKVYFPQPGDSPEVVQQKAAARLQAVKSFIGETRGFFTHTSPDQAKYFETLTGSGKPAAPKAAGGTAQRYVNPTTGQTIEWNGSQWVQVE